MDIAIERPGWRRDREFGRRAHGGRYGSRQLSASCGNPWFLALTALGVVYGDIGHQPALRLSGRARRHRHSVPELAEVLGIVSLISGR